MQAMKKELGKILTGTGPGGPTLGVSFHHNFFKPGCLLEQLNSGEFLVNFLL